VANHLQIRHASAMTSSTIFIEIKFVSVLRIIIDSPTYFTACQNSFSSNKYVVCYTQERQRNEYSSCGKYPFFLNITFWKTCTVVLKFFHTLVVEWMDGETTLNKLQG
jgi:hypothetical protein